MAEAIGTFVAENRSSTCLENCAYTVYEHLINLDPSISKAVNLLCVNEQIRSEFGSLYLSQGNATVDFPRLESFLRVFFLPSANLVPKDAARGFHVILGSVGRDCSLDLLHVALVMRQYPLLNIKWEMNIFDRIDMFSDTDIATAVSILRSMSVPKFEKLASVILFVFEPGVGHKNGDAVFVGAELDITLKKCGTIPHAIELGFDDECEGIDVEIDMESDSESECEQDGSDIDEDE